MATMTQVIRSKAAGLEQALAEAKALRATLCGVGCHFAAVDSVVDAVRDSLLEARAELARALDAQLAA